MKKLVRILTGLYSILFAAMLFTAAAVGLIFRIRMERGIENDRPLFVMHDFRAYIPLLVLTAAVLFLLMKFFASHPAVRERTVLVIALITAGVLSLWFIWLVKGLPTSDANTLNQIIDRILEGDLSDIRGPATGERWYLGIYPFQITYVFTGEIIGRLFGPDRFIVYQLLNVISILLTVLLLYGIARVCFEEKGAALWTAVLSAGMLFLFLYSSHIYNDIWSIAPQTAALYFAVRYLKNGRLRDGIFCAIGMALSVFFKSNCYIALVAVEIMMFLSLLQQTGQKKSSGMREENTAAASRRVPQWAVTLILMILMPLLCRALTGAVSDLYARRAGMESMPGGTPAVAYFAMGMREGDNSYGWYNGYNAWVIQEYDYDSAAAAERSAADMKASIAEFTRRPKYAVKFYLMKFLSQWLDPTCCSMREYELTARHQEGKQPAVLQDYIFGKRAYLIEQLTDVYHTLIYILVLVYLILSAVRARQKRKETGEYEGIGTGPALLILFILGGMLFHQIWEASSRYVLRYYIAMIPLAGAGLSGLFQALTKKSKPMYDSNQKI
ncbi:MAG: glycosyltransferase family 39 protein [Lachnospiraceae bacterium]|nr:glycosyltransferase family 39 protein [Lachnospiraceae bacterium]